MTRGAAFVALFLGVSTFGFADPASAASVKGELHAIDCASATSCVAVGGVASKPLVGRWNGSAWSYTTLTRPAGATTESLGGVACVTATNCIAVGSYSIGEQENPGLALHWNGSTWTFMVLAQPSGTVEGWSLEAVSCVNATSCVAVGTVAKNHSTIGIAERWNGNVWKLMALPSVGGASLFGVSCATATSCVAVGRRTVSGLGNTLAEHWNGTTWKVLATPNPAGTQNAVLEGVACLSATNCWADGDNQYDAVEKSFIQHWNGTKWSMAAASFPAKSFLAGISCASATSCAVVGGQRSGSGYRPLAERWNGSTWTTVTTPDANGFVDVFDGVSCVNGSNCHAAGYDILDTPAQPISTLTMRWNGTKWSLT